MAGQGRQGSGQGLPTYNAVPLVERERALLVPLPARNEEGWEKKVNPVKYLDPGPGPGVVPEAIISVSLCMVCGTCCFSKGTEVLPTAFTVDFLSGYSCLPLV